METFAPIEISTHGSSNSFPISRRKETSVSQTQQEDVFFLDSSKNGSEMWGRWKKEEEEKSVRKEEGEGGGRRQESFAISLDHCRQGGRDKLHQKCFGEEREVFSLPTRSTVLHRRS